MNSVMVRKLTSNVFVGFCLLSVLLALTPLAFVLFFVVRQGIQSLNFDFFVHMPAPVGEAGGGMANAIVGTLIVTGLGALFAVPVGVLSAVFISEYKNSPLATAARFAADTLNGVPSIVVGVFVYAVAVLPFKQFSALAGGLALGIMMIPIVTRTTEELLLLVPSTMKEGALALGATRARAVFSVVLPAALPGIVSGCLLAVARAAGETAPLLFAVGAAKAFNWSVLDEANTALSMQIFANAMDVPAAQERAWGAALTLVLLTFLLTLAARTFTGRFALKR
jgi:phosphate transport system permease protein